ncbi:MAG: hypothetical protein RLZZ628_1280 [Bacteroidota bacterium]|jgi:hypothetical protein
MIKIPYGESDYRKVILGNYFYQDRTHYIPFLETHGGSFLLFLRPRRFGKSLTTSMLRYYYGAQYKNDFQTLFGNYSVGQNPTAFANQYMILHFDFSGINTTSEEKTAQGFMKRIVEGADKFFKAYPKAFTKEQQKKILERSEPNELASALLTAHDTNGLQHKIYVLIDEYDHFANELISFNFPYFSQAVSQNGFVRKFYEVLKIATWDSTIDRIFITGVSPITMDSMTSGFNIASNITLKHRFHDMMGFTESEVRKLMQLIEVPENQLDSVMNDLRLWYDGYRFEGDIPHHLYNPNMVLYFAQLYQDEKKYPKELLDANIASDYMKIRNLFNIQNQEGRFIAVLDALTQQGEIASSLVRHFSLQRDFNSNDLVSLLFYMGFLTIKTDDLGGYIFTFPNYVIKKLYNNYFLELVRNQTELQIDNLYIDNAIKTMARDGNPTAFFDQVAQIVKRMSPRDAAHFTENSLKAIVVSLLHQQNFYYVHTEYETDWKYMDVFLEAIRGYKVNFDVALELKFAKKAGKVAINTLFKEANQQLKDYLATDKFNQRTNIKSWILVVAGDKLAWRALT